MRMRVFYLYALAALICSTQAYAFDWELPSLDWKRLMDVDTGSAMNAIQRAANYATQDHFSGYDNLEVFNSIFAVYKAAKQLEGQFPYDKSRDQYFSFRPSITSASQSPYVDWVELEKVNVRTSIAALWDVARNVDLYAYDRMNQSGSAIPAQLRIFLRLSYQYFQMKR